MKETNKKIFKGLLLFFAINFAINFATAVPPVTLIERFFVGLLLFWNPSSLLILFFKYPIIFFASIILTVVGYYFYSNSLISKKIKDTEEKNFDEQQTLSSNYQSIKTNSSFRAFDNIAAKKFFLALLVFWIILFVIAIFIYDPGVAMGMLLILPFMASFVFYLLYFIILTVRYTREKSEMHMLDKITFYLLIATVIAWAILKGTH